MAANAPTLQSSPVPIRTTPPMRATAIAPYTPVHSPHHSVTSSLSYRTPVHTLSIHEYRKQQNTPTSGPATPVGKTLRRKPAAPALNTIERVPSARHTPSTGSWSSIHSLHPSRSAQQLHSLRSPSQSRVPAEQLLRSQSAEPRTQVGSISGISTSSAKVRHFNSRKRLPRPPATTDSIVSSSSRLGPAKAPYLAPRPPLATALDITTEGPYPSDALTTPTASTLSLSRFPHPPRLVDPIYSPLHESTERTTIDAYNFTAATPATPPATPATIHYRGASFDLVNPHDSLLLHDIVTPSRDFGSSEFLVVPSYEEPLVVSSEMAPKRALYGDLDSAHAGIMRRVEDSFHSSNIDLPRLPTPAAVSPGSSTYTSPIYSPQSYLAPSPLAIKRSPSESRFSLKQLTRNLTRRLVKTPETDNVQELQEYPDLDADLVRTGVKKSLSRPLKETYIVSPEASYYPLSPTSPMTPQDQTLHQERHLFHDENDKDDLPRSHSINQSFMEPLASLIPDECSTQVGRAEVELVPPSSSNFLLRTYYDLDSIYPNSSIYTVEGNRRSDYQQSLRSDHQSDIFMHHSSVYATEFAHEYNSEAFSDRGRHHHHDSSEHLHQSGHHSAIHDDKKADTISKIIDQYRPHNITNQAHSIRNDSITEEIGSQGPEPPANKTPTTVECPVLAESASGTHEFEFGWLDKLAQNHASSAARASTPTPVRRYIAMRNLGDPPLQLAPLAPSFEYDISPKGSFYQEQSDHFSDGSFYSYGDTRNLLQIPQAGSGNPTDLVEALQPSSSYSRPVEMLLEGSSTHSQVAEHPSPRTPQEALDEAEKIFQHMSSEQPDLVEPIPAIWTRRRSGSLLLSKNLTNQKDPILGLQRCRHVEQTTAADEYDGDWESVAWDSREARQSLDSIADYSSSSGSTRNSLYLGSDNLTPSNEAEDRLQGLFVDHSGKSQPHRHALVSSPPSPALPSSGIMRIDSSRPYSSLEHKQSRIGEVSADDTHLQSGHDPGESVVNQRPAFSPWVDPYAFNEKETQELLASGPNDNIMVDYRRDMKETVSSVAPSGSPGSVLVPSVDRHPSLYTGFYASPFPTRGSVTQISQPQSLIVGKHRSTISQETSCSTVDEFGPVKETSAPRRMSHQPTLRCSTSFPRSDRRMSRTSVPGQTRLREMILSPEAVRKTLSSQDTSFSHFMGSTNRPSTSDTITPLHEVQSNNTASHTRTIVAHQHSPHLLCPERAVNLEDEERRRKLSWTILGLFCFLPPCIILYRLWGDSIIASITHGQLGHCTPKSKKIALVAGIAVNIGVATMIVVVIVITRALGAA